jgi:hypothetical protein
VDFWPQLQPQIALSSRGNESCDDFWLAAAAEVEPAAAGPGKRVQPGSTATCLLWDLTAALLITPLHCVHVQVCQVDLEDLKKSKAYCLKKKVCPDHLQVSPSDKAQGSSFLAATGFLTASAAETLFYTSVALCISVQDAVADVSVHRQMLCTCQARLHPIVSVTSVASLSH